MITARPAALLALCVITLGACGYEEMFRFDQEAQCWRQDRPDDLDISSCERAGDGRDLGLNLNLQDPDGNCWRMQYCSDYPIWIEEGGWGPWDGETCQDEMEHAGRC